MILYISQIDVPTRRLRGGRSGTFEFKTVFNRRLFVWMVGVFDVFVVYLVG